MLSETGEKELLVLSLYHKVLKFSRKLIHIHSEILWVKRQVGQVWKTCITRHNDVSFILIVPLQKLGIFLYFLNPQRRLWI